MEEGSAHGVRYTWCVGPAGEKWRWGGIFSPKAKLTSGLCHALRGHTGLVCMKHFILASLWSQVIHPSHPQTLFHATSPCTQPMQHQTFRPQVPTTGAHPVLPPACRIFSF